VRKQRGKKKSSILHQLGYRIVKTRGKLKKLYADGTGKGRKVEWGKEEKSKESAKEEGQGE